MEDGAVVEGAPAVADGAEALRAETTAAGAGSVVAVVVPPVALLISTRSGRKLRMLPERIAERRRRYLTLFDLADMGRVPFFLLFGAPVLRVLGRVSSEAIIRDVPKRPLKAE
ncbi:MAG: hypothetical protein ACYDEB_07300 [Dehalococcoidia bacterium]